LIPALGEVAAVGATDGIGVADVEGGTPDIGVPHLPQKA
jgi:hypothetical protein